MTFKTILCLAAAHLVTTLGLTVPGRDKNVVEASFRLSCHGGRPMELVFKQADYDRCFQSWKQSCEEHWRGDTTSVNRICNKYLDRPHLKSHLTLTASQVRAMMRRHLSGHWAGNAMPRLFTPRYTALGWKVERPPIELHQRVADWYESQRYRMLAEDWPSVDDVGCNNNYDNDDFLIPHDEAPPVMAIGKWIKEHLQQWMGTEVDPTWHIFYGARLQHSGSTCGMHVDSGTTHVMSATYNIAQKGMKKSWPLSFVEPGGTVSKVEQRPGDIIFYEGASGMHGRPDPLDGQEFVSIYFHFRPKDWNQRLATSLPHSEFGNIVEVKESPENAGGSFLEFRTKVLNGGECPANGEDTHAAAEIPELWRGAHTISRRVFDPSQVSLAQIQHRLSSVAGDLSSGPAASNAAARAVEKLGLYDYVSLHARSHANASAVVSPATVLARWVGYLQPGTTLYVAGDGAKAYRSKDLGTALGLNIRTADDYPWLKALHLRNAELLICAHARLFIGSSEAGGFTGDVHSLRVKAGAPSTVLLQHQDTITAPRDALRAAEVGHQFGKWKGPL